jgi:DNA-binding NarL/FixJ family response regulator
MPVHTLIVAGSPLREFLVVVLNSMPGISGVDAAPDTDLALMMLRENRPSLIFLDAGLQNGKGLLFLHQLRQEAPQARCVALIERMEQHRQATEWGAASVLLKGFSMAQLSELIETLYPDIKEGKAYA